MTDALPIREFRAAIRPALESLGLRHRSGDLYTISLDEEFLVLIALGRAMKRRRLEIWPTVGVRHQPTERRLAELLDVPFHPYAPATIVAELGYVMPTGRYKQWVVDNVGATALEIAGAVAEYGLPAIHARASLASVLKALEGSDALSSPNREYLLPLVLATFGRGEESWNYLDAQVLARSLRTDPEADQSRRFADRLGKTARQVTLRDAD